MSDQFTEVTTEGWGQRLGGSLIAALIGLILVPASIVLLLLERRARGGSDPRAQPRRR